MGQIDDYPIDQDQIDKYRRDGFIVLENVVTGGALETLREVVENAVEIENKIPAGQDAKRPKSTYEKVFIQKVNIWQRHENLKEFTLSRALGNIAAKLEHTPMRVWHDHALFKEPGLGDNRTPWHQDAVYWPHADRWRQTTIWIALRDATVANGCMSFIPGTQVLGPLPPIDLGDPADIFDQAAHLKKTVPVPCPLKAGSVTFHNGLTFHCAGPNMTDATREAYAIIYMPEDTCYDGKRHMVTDALDIEIGVPIEGDGFPKVS